MVCCASEVFNKPYQKLDGILKTMDSLGKLKILKFTIKLIAKLWILLGLQLGKL